MDNRPFYGYLVILGMLLLALFIAFESAEAGTGSCSSKELETIAEMNRERNAQDAIDGRNRPDLRADFEMCTAADIRCNEIRTRFSHYRPNGTYFNTVFNQVGQPYARAGENIGRYYYDTPAEIVDAWMGSGLGFTDQHRANVLAKKHTLAGVGWCGTSNHVVALFVGLD